MAYYISFLKTLSLKLNVHTIHFFFNEVISWTGKCFIQNVLYIFVLKFIFTILVTKLQHTNDFPLYTEAIKFFNHSESMVRIAVRTLTLNVYKVFMIFYVIFSLKGFSLYYWLGEYFLFHFLWCMQFSFLLIWILTNVTQCFIPKVGDEVMLSFIRDRTAAPYFSNLVWFIGNHIVELDNCVRADAE